MGIFNNKGMMVFPNPQKKQSEHENIIVVKDAFCSNGHSLINKRVRFNGLDGIYLKVKHSEKSGYVGLSPIFGDKSRIFIDIDLVKNDIIDLFCPTCDTLLPIFSTCSCGSKFIALYTSKELNFKDCIGICNRVDCVNSEIISGNQLITFSMIDPNMFY